MNAHAHTRHVFSWILLMVAASCTSQVMAQTSVPPIDVPPVPSGEVIEAPPQQAPVPLMWAPPPPPGDGPRKTPDVDDYVGFSGTHSGFRVGAPITVHALKSSWSKAHEVPNPLASETELLAAISTEVIAVNSDGSVQIQGLLTTSSNGRDHIFRITGSVSPEDIDAGSVVDSRRVTKASMELEGDDVADPSERKRRIEHMFKLLRLQRTR